uniref:Peptidase_M10 domain-containing protein n=1 Tax=Globodera pallida TaxID=36090 RepID=A0A183BPF9_GLOPA
MQRNGTIDSADNFWRKWRRHGAVFITARVTCHELGHTALLWFKESAGAYDEAIRNCFRTGTAKIRNCNRFRNRQNPELQPVPEPPKSVTGTGSWNRENSEPFKPGSFQLAKALTRDHAPAHRTKARLVRRQQELIDEAHERATAVIAENAVAIERMALFLFKRKTIGRAEFEKLIGFPPINVNAWEEGDDDDDDDDGQPVWRGGRRDSPEDRNRDGRVKKRMVQKDQTVAGRGGDRPLDG